MTAIRIRVKTDRGGRGWENIDATFVPHTDKIFAVNREGEAWIITHVSTGYRMPSCYPSKKIAVKIAQEAYHRIRCKRLLKSPKISEARKAMPQTVRAFLKSQGL